MTKRSKPAAKAPDPHAAARAEHTADVAALNGKLDQAKAAIARSKKLATSDPQHLSLSREFVKRAHLLVDEFNGWVERHVPAKTKAK